MRRFWLLCLVCFLSGLAWGQGRLEEITRRGVLRVGTTGDYPPFSLLQDGHYDGLDIRLARLAAERLGVRIEFVPTRWDSLLEDLSADRFDLAVGGITRTLARARRAGFTRPLLTVGKCPLVRRSDVARLASLRQIDRPEVRVAVNPGGTNESYARQHLKRAQIVVIANNLLIPAMIARGEVDVLITDSVEAERASRRDTHLAVASKPWTRETLAWLTPRDDQAFLNWLNLFLEEAEGDGTLERFRRETW